MRFTDRSVKGLKPREDRYEVFEDGRKGLGLRISPTGGKSWIFVYRRSGKLTRITMGRYPEMTLADAHMELTRLRGMLRKGTDPGQAERVARLEEIRAPTVAQLCELYLERYAKPLKRSWGEDQRILNKDVLPRWGHVKARDIVRRDVIALLDDIVDRGAPIQANRSLACMRKMFNFAVERSILETSPCIAVKRPGRETQRDRVLNEKEIQKFWNALDGMNASLAIRCALKLQLVTAQRKGEVLGAEWPEVDLAAGWWNIPAEKAKNRLAHRVPLSRLALELLSQVPRLSERFVFSSRQGDRPLRDVDHVLRRSRDAFGIAHFTPHDLRRTAASHMAGMGISRLVLSKILNHVETGITAVYDRHSYDGEKRVALDAWARRLEGIIHGAGSNVVPLTRPGG